MNALSITFYISMSAWFITEIYYKQRLKSSDSDEKGKDKSTLNILWIVIILSIFFGIFVSKASNFPITNKVWILYLGEVLMLVGIITRIIIIRSLGKYFTVDVTIKEGHEIKKEGFYKYLRHPSYTASLLTFLGLGLFLNNWASLVLIFIPTFLAFSYRIKIEEEALVEQFGAEYIEYRKSTKRLIPFIY